MVKRLFWDELGFTGFGMSMLLVAVMAGALLWITTGDENVYDGPINGCIKVTHHDNHLLGRGNTQSSRIYCE